MTQASEIMTRNPLFLYSSDLITHAVDLFLKHKISVMPVMTPAHEMLGGLTETAIMKIALLARNKDAILLDFKQLLEPLSLILERDGADQVVQSLMKSHHHRVFVQDGAGRLAGVISPKDLLPVIVNVESGSETVQREVQRLRIQIAQLEELKKEIPVMRKQVEMLENLLDSNQFLVVGLDQNDKIAIYNKYFQSEIGLTDLETRTISIFDLFAKETLPELRALFDGVKKHGGHRTSYLVLNAKNNTREKVEVTCRLQSDGSGLALMIRKVDPDELIRLLNGVIRKD